MKKILLTVSFFAIVIFANAQAPTFQWVKDMGGLADSYGNSISLDSLGNVYTIGSFYGTVDFDPGSGIYNLTSDSLNTFDIFISKIDAFGNLLWAKKMGGKLNDFGYSIAIDKYGNVCTSGCFRGTADFDPGVGTFNMTSLGGTDVFVSKLDSAGNFVWAENIGGIGSKGAAAYSIALDSANNVYTTGYFAATVDFDPGPGIFNLTSYAGADDIFISKLDSAGNFVWAKNMMAGGADGLSITIDRLGNVYTTGLFNGTPDFDPGSGTYNLTAHMGGFDAFISKLDHLGNFVWAKNIGGTSSFVYGESITTDIFGNVYTTGWFNGTADFDPGAGISNLSSSNHDIFISKLNSSGNFLWAREMGGTLDDEGNSIRVEGGNIYTTGMFQGTADFDPGIGVANIISKGDYDIYISKIDTSGSFVWAGSMGDIYSDIGASIVLDASGNIYTTGIFQGTVDFDPGVGIFNLNELPSGGEVFVQKMSPGSMATALIQNINNNAIAIYPNPANNFIDIETDLKDYSISVFDTMGKLILKEKAAQNKTRIDVSGFTAGIYFLQLQTDDKVMSKKFIKE